VKPYGDIQAFGKCKKEIRLLLVDQLKTHKERARAQKYRAP